VLDGAVRIEAAKLSVCLTSHASSPLISAPPNAGCCAWPSIASGKRAAGISISLRSN
jgi:hypothetical protein